MVNKAVVVDLPRLSLLVVVEVKVHKLSTKVAMVKQQDSKLQLINQNKHFLAMVLGVSLLQLQESKVEVLAFK